MLLIEAIKNYRQMDGTDILKVFCKPTQKFPEGNNYFYVNAEDGDIIDSYTWLFKTAGKDIVILSHISDTCNRTTINLHQELAYKYLGYYPDCIDHVNGLRVDNTDKNLNVVTFQQNNYNRHVKGYIKVNQEKVFRARILINYERIYPYSRVHSEAEACQLQYKLETDYLRDRLGSDYYMYNFLEDRRGSLDILDLERTGQISHEEATYRHILKYADNAWYYYRYGLEDFFKEHHIPVPEYSLDDEGYMIDKITGKKLCPFYK